MNPPTTETAETLAREIAVRIYESTICEVYLEDVPQIQALVLEKLLHHFALLADTQLQLSAIRELADTDSIKRTQARLADAEKALGECVKAATAKLPNGLGDL